MDITEPEIRLLLEAWMSREQTTLLPPSTAHRLESAPVIDTAPVSREEKKKQTCLNFDYKWPSILSSLPIRCSMLKCLQTLPSEPVEGQEPLPLKMHI
jgi:hypothetical protein